MILIFFIFDIMDLYNYRRKDFSNFMSCDILLCDLDAFFATVEQRDNPELMGKPVIVGGDPGSRGVVSTCSYEARRYGVSSSMPMKKARKLCPTAVILPVNMPKYKEMSGRVLDIFKEFTPDIEKVSIDEAYLAVKAGTGLKTARKIRFVVQKRLKLPLSIGVSSNKLLAKIACSLAKPDNIKALWPKETEKTLWLLPVKVLPGVGPVTEQKLNLFGIKTVGDIVSFPLGALENIVGSHAINLKEYAHGRDDRKLEFARERKSYSEEITFPRDIYEKDYILAVIHDLSGELGYRLRSKGLEARTVAVKLRLPDLSIKTRSATMAGATAGDEKIYAIAADLFDRCCGKPPWRLVGVRVSGLEKGSQLTLFSEENKKKEKIRLVLDMLRQRYGPNAVFKGRRLFMMKKDVFDP